MAFPVKVSQPLWLNPCLHSRPVNKVYVVPGMEAIHQSNRVDSLLWRLIQLLLLLNVQTVRSRNQNWILDKVHWETNQPSWQVDYMETLYPLRGSDSSLLGLLLFLVWVRLGLQYLSAPLCKNSQIILFAKRGLKSWDPFKQRRYHDEKRITGSTGSIIYYIV